MGLVEAPDLLSKDGVMPQERGEAYRVPCSLDPAAFGLRGRSLTWTPFVLSVQVALVCRFRQVAATSVGVRKPIPEWGRWW